MPFNYPQFTIRIEPELLIKLRYIAEYNARSANCKVEVLIKNHVKQFEKEHGNIMFND